MTCSYMVEDGRQCDQPGKNRVGVVLCDEHWPTYRATVSAVDTSLRQSLKYRSLDDYPGYCYFLLLPDGKVKIGYSNTIKLLLDRFKSLYRDLGAVVPLAVCRGGWVAERFFHLEYMEYRDFSGVEAFHYVPAIANKVLELGIHPDAAEAVAEFGAWTATRLVAA